MEKAGEQEIIILLSDALLRTGIGAGFFYNRDQIV